MKYALISDIHGNLQALERVIEDIAERQVDEIYCVGDIVGYGAQPSECITEIKRICRGSVAGNHDWAAVGKTDIGFFNKEAKAAVLWTSENLDFEEKRFLAELPLKLYFDNAMIVHGTPVAPEKWDYLLYTNRLGAQFAYFSEPICFIGHSHVPVVWTNAYERIPPDTEKPLELEEGRRYIINVGSVGQPRDGDPRACYSIFDSEKKAVYIRRVEYDIDTAANLIRDAGLPEKLASRLYRGF